MSARRLAFYLAVLAVLAFGVYHLAHALLDSVGSIAAARNQAAGKVN